MFRMLRSSVQCPLRNPTGTAASPSCKRALAALLRASKPGRLTWAVCCAAGVRGVHGQRPALCPCADSA